MNNQNNKKVILTVMFVAILTIVVIGTSFAFFNYTRTGSANTLKVGRISFNHTQDGNITLTNIFPMSSEEFENSTQDPSNNVTINIEGDTTYPNGVEYLVTAEDVNIEVNNKRIPLTLKVTSTTDLGNNDEDYFTNRGGSTNIHKVLSGGVVVDGQYLVVGYIAPGQTGIDGSLNISAYINSDNIVISDTYDGTESDNMGTTNNWVENKTVFTTTEWNSLSGSSNSLSFKIRVEANEGIWVDPYTTPNLMNSININRNAVNIKEIRFIEETPLRMQRRYDASVGSESDNTKLDLTYQDTGKVLAWIEPVSVNPTGTSSNLNIKPSFLVNENTNNNLRQIDNETSYILYIASSGKTKWVYTGTSNIFNGFINVEKIVFENFDTSSVPIMNDMFKDLSKLTSVNMTALDTSGVYQMTGLFSGCSSLTNIDLSGLGSNNLAGISNMFYNCNALTEIIMKNFNFGQVNFNSNYNYNYAFAYLPNVETIDLTNANTSGVTSMKCIFNCCIKLKNIIGLNTLDTSNVTDMEYMFGNCSSLINLDLSGLGGNNLNNVNGMFSSCSGLKELNMSNFNFGTISSFNDGIFYPLKEVLEIIDLSGANFSGPNITTSSFNRVFQYFKKLKSVDLNNANTSKVITMNDMFGGCKLLEYVNLEGIDTSNVTNMSYMFDDCDAITKLDLKHLNTSKVTTMHYMFRLMDNLEEIDLSGWGNDNLSDTYGMFDSDNKLKKITMCNFNLGQSTDGMFRDCGAEIIDLSGVKTSNVTDMTGMFKNCTNLKTIYASQDFDTSKLTGSNSSASSMFSDCTSLVGGNGTVYDSSKSGSVMAVIDTPTTPGYLTLKTS